MNEALFNLGFDRASDISRKKSKISRDFQGQIRGKIGRFRGIFRGKFAEKSADFAGFSGANSRKNRPILRDFRGKKVKIRRKISQFRGSKVKIRRKIGRFQGILAEKSQISKDFQGKCLKKSADFTGNFGGKLRQETISKKQPILLDFFWQISLKSINFASI